VLDEGCSFYYKLSLDLQSKQGVECWLSRDPNSDGLQITGDSAARFLEPSELTNSVRALCAGCLLCLGDLARYRELLQAGVELEPSKAKHADWAAARKLYFAALQARTFSRVARLGRSCSPRSHTCVHPCI
ncbi:MAG: hypothetical protein SGPRY_003778, partial [Prymnesium sp.]